MSTLCANGRWCFHVFYMGSINYYLIVSVQPEAGFTTSTFQMWSSGFSGVTGCIAGPVGVLVELG